MGLVYRTNTTADVNVTVPRSGTTHRAIVVFPGYIMPGGTLGRAFAPYVADDDAMVVVSYAERGVDVSQIYDKGNRWQDMGKALDDADKISLTNYEKETVLLPRSSSPPSPTASTTLR